MRLNFIIPIFIFLLNCSTDKKNIEEDINNITPPKIEKKVETSLTFTPGIQKGFLQQDTAASYGFFLYTPASYDITKTYPLLIHLHGGGARGNSANLNTLNAVAYDGPPLLINQKKWAPPTPMIVVAPQSPTIWNAENLHAFISYITQNLSVDPLRIYMTGLSMGARGCYDYVTTYGDASYTAAIVPIAGRSLTDNGLPFKNIPVWTFHGDADDVINVKESKEIINAINTENPSIKAKLTIFPKVDHFSWPIVYDSSGIGKEDPNYNAFNMTIYDWMLQYIKKEE